MGSSAPGADPVVPVRGAYSGKTAAGEAFSMVVKTKKAGPGKRREVKRTAGVGAVDAAIPITCNSGPGRSEEVGFPGPLEVGRNGRFGTKAFSQQIDGDRVNMTIAGRFTGRRVASGKLTYRGGFDGEFCSGAVKWAATR
jgi:hypothetical protein